MAARQSRKAEPPKVIEAISRFAGTLVGTAVVTSKRIVDSVAPPSKGPSGKAGEKTVRAPAKKKEKVIKRKTTGSSGKSGASKKKSIQSPAKKKKAATRAQKSSAQVINKPESGIGG